MKLWSRAETPKTARLERPGGLLNWDVDLLAKVVSLEWRSRVLVDGFLQGPHRSEQRGYSAEFAQYHPYIQGDDPRHLDWKAYARFDRLYIREYDAETNLRMQVVVDGSRSMDFRSEQAPWRKYDYAALLAAALMRLVRRHNDAFGLSLLAGTVQEYLPVASSTAHFLRCIGRLEHHETFAAGDLPAELFPVAERLQARSSVVIITDAWCDLDAMRLALQRLRFDHHDCCLLQVIDPQERDFSLGDVHILEDLENGQRLPVVQGWSQDRYQQAMREHQQNLHDMCRGLGVQHRLVVSDEAPFHALADALAARRRTR